MTYVFGWLGLVGVSLWVSLLAFVWAMKSGQFAEQERLRYLPLRDEPTALQAGQPPQPPFGVYVLLGISGCVGAVFLVALFLSLIT
jgi:cbb3-type cytochrome oxidase maturation protein